MVHVNAKRTKTIFLFVSWNPQHCNTFFQLSFDIVCLNMKSVLASKQWPGAALWIKAVEWTNVRLVPILLK